MALQRKLSSYFYKDLPQFFKSRDFSKAVMIGIAITTPILIGLWVGEFEVGLALCFGAFWCSPSDVSGSFRHKKIGILFSAALVMIVSLIGGYLDYQSWISLPILGVLTFAIAFLSVYGFRASLISFSGLLALVLSFAHEVNDIELWQYSLLVGVGGLWYFLLTIVWHRLSRKAQTEEILVETYLLTADFLETRSKLVEPKNDRKELKKKLHEIQIKLIDHHATLREILMLSRQKSGKSNYEGRRLLIFVQLVEMLETAIANPVNHDKMDALFKENTQYIKSFQNLIYEMVNQLRLIARAGSDAKKLPKNKELTALFENLDKEIAEYGRIVSYGNYAGFTMLKNLLEYQEKQITKIKRIKWLLGNADLEGEELVDKSVSKLFIASQDYDPAILLRNFSFRSNIFKHSLRLAVTLMVGYIAGTIFDSQTPYWILLTIIVIMRPGYGLTKSRSKDRIIGTLIGAVIALGLVFIVRSPYAYAAMGVVSLIIAFSMVQRNYKASATFVTLSVVFIYAITRPDVLNVIQFRILDTAVGAALSYMAMRWLWPAWGFLEINKNIETSVCANKNFLGQIAHFYQQKGQVPITYKVSRKEAFLETSNLSSAFQRMAQEPKSKQINLPEIYELVELNHTFLSALASLSTYIQFHPTTSASPAFNAAIAKIDRNLSEVLRSLKVDFQESKLIEIEDDSFFKEQIEAFQEENEPENGEIDNMQVRNFQEAHLVWEQLRWLYSLSFDMLRITSSIRFD